MRPLASRQSRYFPRRSRDTIRQQRGEAGLDRERRIQTGVAELGDGRGDRRVERIVGFVPVAHREGERRDGAAGYAPRREISAVEHREVEVAEPLGAE
mgnify:CR=1 FL=1